MLALSPTHPEALAFLSEHYAAEERWDYLVEVDETSLAGDAGGRERLGDILQVGMLLWKKRQDPGSAEPWFARLRKLDPANIGMLDFYREFYAADESAPQLLNDAISTGVLAGSDAYTDQHVAILRALVALDRHGIEPRHVRTLRQSAERDVARREAGGAAGDRDHGRPGDSDARSE